MKVTNEEKSTLRNIIIDRDKQERTASASITMETLTKLNISIDALPQISQQLLNEVASTQASLEMNQRDPISISLQNSREVAKRLEEEYEILKLNQKNSELQRKIDRNNKFLEGLRKDLLESRKSMGMQNPNPDNIQKYIREFKQKLGSYEASCEKSMMKFNNLSVPESLYPESLQSLISSLATLQAEATSLEQQASDKQLVRDARDTLNRFK